MRLDSNGNLLLGVMSQPTAYRLNVNGGVNGVLASASAATGATCYPLDVFGNSSSTASVRMRFGTAANVFDTHSYIEARTLTSTTSDMRLGVSGVEAVRIDSTGNFLVGKAGTDATSAGGSMYLGRANYMAAAGTVSAFYNAGASGAQVGSIAISTTATSYNTTSDYRLKTALVPMNDAVEKVLALRPGYHGWLADPEAGNVPGWYAHELQRVVPTAVTGQRDEVDEDARPVYQAVDNSKVVPLLAAALQAALRRIELLETRLGPVAG
jgi:hypothetical protein